MDRYRPLISRPEDFNCWFWDILLLLAGEPAFGFLLEALSGPPEASSVHSLHGTWAFFAETPEGGLEEAAWLPHAEETRGLPDAGKWNTGDQASGGFPPHREGQWSLQALRLVERAGHPLIWREYNWGLILFIDYRESIQAPSTWPIPGQQLQGFLLSLDLEGVSAPQIATYLSSLSYLSRTFNFQDPLQDVFTSKMIACMKWEREPPIPLSMDILGWLLEILESVCDCFYECLMFRALFLLSYHAALKPKEMVAKTCTTFHPELLCVDDIEMEEDHIALKIAAPAMGAGRIMCWLRSAEEPSHCPILALKNYLAVRPHGEGPLFVYPNWRLLCKPRFLEVFHEALRRLYLPAEQYRINSFWLGALTTAVHSGFPESAVLQLARWPCQPFPGIPRN